MKPQQQLVELGSLRGQVAILHPGGRELRERYRSPYRIEPVTALNLCLFERQPLVCRPLAVKGVGRGVIPAIWAGVASLPAAGRELPNSSEASAPSHQAAPRFPAPLTVTGLTSPAAI